LGRKIKRRGCPHSWKNENPSTQANRHGLVFFGTL
jgi:hypothetical protein